MDSILLIKLVGADSQCFHLFVEGIKTSGMDKSVYKVNGKSIREIADSFGYSDFKILEFYARKGFAKDLSSLPC